MNKTVLILKRIQFHISVTDGRKLVHLLMIQCRRRERKVHADWMIYICTE